MVIRTYLKMELDFDKMNGLVAAIIQDNETCKVLMLGFMNKEAYDKTVETGKVTYAVATFGLHITDNCIGHCNDRVETCPCIGKVFAQEMCIRDRCWFWK